MQEPKPTERPFNVDFPLVTVVCRKCGAAFLIYNARPVNKRIAFPYAYDVSHKAFTAFDPPRYGKFGRALGKGSKVTQRRLEEAAARAFACAWADHSDEYLELLSVLQDRGEMPSIMDKRVPYNEREKSVTLWTDKGELVRVTGDVAIEWYGKQIRRYPKAVIETLWVTPAM